MPIIGSVVGIRAFGGIGHSGSQSGGGGSGYDYWIAEFDDQSGTIGYDSTNDKIHLDQGHVGNSPKIITLNMDGTVDQVKNAAQLIAGAYVSDSYNNPSVIYEDHWYPAYSDSGGGAVGKLQYPFTSSGTFYTPSNANSQGGYPIYPYDGVAITNWGNSSESKHFIGSAQPSGGNVNDPYWFIATWNQPTVGIRRHRITYSGYTRNYPDGIAGIRYGGVIGIASGLSSTGSGPYPASFMTITYDWNSGVVSSNTSAKVVNNATSNYAYSMRLFGWNYSDNWLHTINCNLEDTHIAVLYNTSAEIRDQIAFDTTKAKLEGAIFDYVFDGNYPNGPYIFFMKDEVTANRYYFVTWDNDDNSNSTSGGSNTGGTWNANSNAVQIDFPNSKGGVTQTYTSCGGKARGERAGDDFVFKADIGPGGTSVVFKMPSNLTKVQASTGTDFSITTGSAVNTRVNTFVDMSKQKSFSTVAAGVTYETNATNSAQSRGTATPGTSWLNQTYIDSVTAQSISYTAGEGLYNFTHGQWRNATDSTTSNPQIWMRANNTDNSTDAVAVRNALDQQQVGDIIEILDTSSGNPTPVAGKTFTITGGINKVVSGNYDNWYWDVGTEGLTNSQYFYRFTVYV